MKSKRDREDPCCICSHYHDYEHGEPCSICGHVMTTTERRQQESVLPTAVIPGSLYLGSYDTASRSEILKAMGITHILNTVPNNQALFKNTFTYHTLATSPPDFVECFQFVDEAFKNGHKVLVYCMSGVSRSPSVVIAYLMQHRQWRLAESYKWVKEKRMSVNIKAEDAARLMDFEKQLFGSTSVPMGLNALDIGATSLGFGAGGSVQQPATASGAPAFSGAAGPVFGGGATSGGGQWSMSAAQPVAFGGAGQPMFGGSFGAAGQGGAFVFGGGTAAPAQAPASNSGPVNDMEL